jgi:hypothetical protein
MRHAPLSIRSFKPSFEPDVIPSSIAHIRGGKLRALAVTAASPSETLPNVKPLANFVPGYEAGGWNGIGTPKGAPPEIIDKLNSAINTGLADPTLKGRFEPTRYVRKRMRIVRRNIRWSGPIRDVAFSSLPIDEASAFESRMTRPGHRIPCQVHGQRQSLSCRERLHRSRPLPTIFCVPTRRPRPCLTSPG